MSMEGAINVAGRAAAVAILAWLGLEYFRPLRGGHAALHHWMCASVGTYCMLMALGLLMPRHPSTGDPPLRDRLLASASFSAPLLMYVVPTAPLRHISDAGYAIAIAGSVGGIFCTFALGKSFGVVPARRHVVTWGPYRIVRHPFYVSATLILVGYNLVWFSPWGLMVSALSFGGLGVMAFLEERALRGDAAYEEYRRRVPWRFVPGLL